MMANSSNEIVAPPQEQSVNQEYEANLLASSAPDQRTAITHPTMPAETGLLQFPAGAAFVQQMSVAPNIGVRDVSPQYICGAVLKNHSLNPAMVQMAFPGNPSEDNRQGT